MFEECEFRKVWFLAISSLLLKGRFSKEKCFLSRIICKGKTVLCGVRLGSRWKCVGGRSPNETLWARFMRWEEGTAANDIRRLVAVMRRKGVKGYIMQCNDMVSKVE